MTSVCKDNPNMRLTLRSMCSTARDFRSSDTVVSQYLGEIELGTPPAPPAHSRNADGCMSAFRLLSLPIIMSD
eukprot:481396-Amphidinium_carterae.1